MVRIYKHCPMCRAYNYIDLDEKAWCKIDSKMYHIQDVLPDFSPAEREFLITGYCGGCQKMLFGSNYSTKRIKFA